VFLLFLQGRATLSDNTRKRFEPSGKRVSVSSLVSVFLRPAGKDGGDRSSVYMKVWVRDEMIAWMEQPLVKRDPLERLSSTRQFNLCDIAGALRRQSRPMIVTFGQERLPMFAIVEANVHDQTVRIELNRAVELCDPNIFESDDG
jgi:hypothetical protein